MKRTKEFDALGNRYVYDWRLCQGASGWAQVDTTLDASFYGVWTNPSTLQILTFCEGDTTLENAESETEYVEAMRQLHTWNIERGQWKGIDTLCDDTLTARIRELGLGALLHQGTGPGTIANPNREPEPEPEPLKIPARSVTSRRHEPPSLQPGAD